MPAGTPCPPSVEDLWKPGQGYAICIDFPPPGPIRRWSDEAKAAVRRRNLERRIMKKAPLFAEELTARELAARPAYYAGKNPFSGD